MSVLWTPPEAVAAPQNFDPLAYGTDGGPSSALVGYAPGNIIGGGGTSFVTGWAATTFNGVIGRDLASPASPRVGPVKSTVGGPHCSFGQIYGGGNAYLQLVGGSKGVNPANCVIAGVIDAAHGLDGAPSQMVVFEIGYANFGLRISPSRFLEVYGDLGSFTTDIRPSAGPMAFALWSTPDGIRLDCSGHPAAVSAAAVSSSLNQSTFVSKILFVGANSGGGYGFKGGVRCLYLWDKQQAGFGQWSPAQLDAAVADLASCYGVVPPTELVVVAGDSYGAGYKLFGGESVAQWMAVDGPARRVINLAQAGAVANDPNLVLPDVLHGQLPRILDERNFDGFEPQFKTVVIFDGHNEIWNQKPLASVFLNSRLAYTSALQAAGFRVVWADINPIAIRNSGDASVTEFETRRRLYRAAVAAAETTAVRLTYCDTAGGLNTGGGTPAEVRQVTRGECYYSPEELRPAGSETWAAGTWSDELHMGVVGWIRIYPYLASAVNGVEPAGACCVGAICTTQSPAACASANARFASIGSACDPNPCEGTCCTPSGVCSLTVQTACVGSSAWTGGATCAAAPCPLPPPTGTCCTPSGVCSITTQADCAALSTWTADATCEISPCPLPPAGTCCTPPGACSITTQADCGALSTWTNGATCEASPCPLPPVGACCSLTAGTCSLVVQADCQVATWVANTPCAATQCETGACCTGTSCSITANVGCSGAASFLGLGTVCGLATNPIACCRANFNGINGLTVQDVFDYLDAWFGGDLRADTNADGHLAVADVFTFLDLWFAGCG